MDAAHLHLVLNHVPILGVGFAGVLFVIARWLGSGAFQRVALAMLVAFALATIPVYLTGESAEAVAEHAPGVAEAAIERHEDAAAAAFVAAEVLGALALLGLVLFRRPAGVPAAFAGLVLLAVATTSGLFAWTGYLGGEIRHGPAIAAAGGHANAARDDDD